MGLFRFAATVSSFTLLSRITGLVRDVLIASSFGAGPLTDAFWVAFRIPNLLRRLFAEGAFSQAFVPILGQIHTQQSEREVQLLLDRVALLLSTIVGVVTLLGILAAPWVVAAMASGLLASAKETEFIAAVGMTRIMFPYILCMALVAFASGVLNTWQRFSVPALTPILLNLSMIAASLFFTPYFATPIYALAAGVIVGGVLQVLVQWLALSHLNLQPRFNLQLLSAWQDPVVKRILHQMMPAILGVSVAQISLLINTNIATWLAPGSVTWLSFADRLMEFPTALLGVALGTVLLPSLSAAFARKDNQAYSALMDWGLRLTLLLGLPAALGLALLADGLVATLFNYGAFNQADVEQTRLAVMAYSVGLLGLLAVKILAPGFYARQDIRTPVRIAIVVLILTQALNLVFVPFYAHAGLALSIGLGASFNALFLLIILRRRKIYLPAPGWGRFLLKILPALCLMALLLYGINSQINWLELRNQAFLRVFYLLLTVGASALTYASALYLFGFRPSDFTQRPN